MAKRLAIGIVFAALLFVFSHPSSAAEGKNNTIADDTNPNIGICNAIKKLVSGELDTRKVVRTSIELGHNACLVIKCAITGGGDLEKIIAGAADAGATTDVISKCATDTGADPSKVAKYVEQAGLPTLCYFTLGYEGEDDEPDDDIPRSPWTF
jgi:hypothetical protein